MKTIQRTMIVACAALLALGASGCGGGDGGSGDTAASPGATTTAPATSTGTVPASAGTSDLSFADYQKGLAPNETASALSLGSFVPLADETSLPVPVE